MRPSYAAALLSLTLVACSHLPTARGPASKPDYRMFPLSNAPVINIVECTKNQAKDGPHLSTIPYDVLSTEAESKDPYSDESTFVLNLTRLIPLQAGPLRKFLESKPTLVRLASTSCLTEYVTVPRGLPLDCVLHPYVLIPAGQAVEFTNGCTTDQKNLLSNFSAIHQRVILVRGFLALELRYSEAPDHALRWFVSALNSKWVSQNDKDTFAQLLEEIRIELDQPQPEPNYSP
jgi:hypothetical protein